MVETGPGNGIIFDSIIPTIVSQFSNAMIGVVVLLVFAASISTLSSLVMTSASTLTLDFLKGHVIKKMNEEKQLLIIRALIVMFIVISSIIAIVQYRGRITFIAQLMGISWGALAGAFLAPFLYGLYWKRTSKASVWFCFVFSAALMSLNILFRNSFPALLRSPINAGAFTMLAGLVIVPVLSIFTRAPDKAAVENCFSCYDETVNVKVRDDLGA
jgi:SSS family solute:Na+ symporter